jgi:hypothetical protein
MVRVLTRAHHELRIRVAVLAAMLAASCGLLILGNDPGVVVTTTVAATVGGVQIGCRLTAPTVAPAVRCVVLVIILVVVVGLLGRGYPPVVAVGLVLSVAGCAAEAARRMAGQSYRLPRLTF